MTDIVDELRACAPIESYSNQGEVETRQSLTSRAADEIERLRYVLGGVRSAILTGRNEPLMIWKDQIDIALSTDN